MTHTSFTRRARILAWGACLTLAALPFLAALSLWQGGLSEAQMREAFAHVTAPADLARSAIWLFRLEAAICFALVCWTFYLLYEWLEACGRGEAFQPDTAGYALRLGRVLLGLALLNVVGRTVIILALTWNNPPGQRSLAIGLEGADVMLLLAASVLTLFGWIQAEAARIAAENEGFV